MAVTLITAGLCLGSAFRLLAAAATAPAAPAIRAGAPPPDAAIESLIAAERAFSRAAGERGIQAAFLEYLADDAVLFRPFPVNGKGWLREHPPDPGLLWWEPSHVEIASAGDLGLSTGPWSYTPAGGTAPVAFGQFASVWRRQPDGGWEVVLDHGISHPPPSGSPRSAGAPAPVSTPNRRPATGGGGDLDGLIAADRSFAAALAGAGAPGAYRGSAAHPGIIVLRSGREPAVGREAAALAAGDDGQLVWEPASAQVSRGGDFGYTYGTARPAAGAAEPARHYARVWRREDAGAWQVVLDVAPVAPRPAPSPPAAPPTPAAAPASPGSAAAAPGARPPS